MKYFEASVIALQEVKRALNSSGQLSRVLTPVDIATAVARQKKIALDTRLIRLEAPIESPGVFDIPLDITLGSGQQANMQIIVGR